ncbi:MAG: D-tyrosyl-tRNA(Tyr) deacylase [Lachnospiraceae bacterium]|nr:D-tyrosyl-tRNA(Tyr) deacylase [Lachnospiraceae bacterium]
MKTIIQRVKNASVTVNEETIGKIEQGFLIFLGVGQDDTKETADRLIKKIINLRIFSDENGKTNLSIKQVNGSILVVSQFTLYADCSHGNRPSFINAASPALANELYEYFIAKCSEEISVVEHGIFGADMDVALINDGPFTIYLES